MSPEHILNHTDWIRRLAWQLARDPSAAEDLVQETCLVALQQPTRRILDPRAWLRTVMRNLWRQERRAAARRRCRETKAARPDPSRDHDDEALLVEKIAIQRHVMEAVLALEPPYRKVIFLRFFEAMPPRRIATHLGIPVETVKSQLQRGLTRLRRDLDRRYGDRRSAWLAAVLTLPGGGAIAAAIPSAAFVMNLKKIAIVGGVLAAGLLGIYYLADASPPIAPPLPGTPTPPLTVTHENRTEPPADTVNRQAVARATSNPAARTSDEMADHPRPITISGRVIDANGRDAAGIAIGFTTDDRVVDSGVDGTFDVPLQEGKHRIVAASSEWTTVLAASAQPEFRDGRVVPIVVVAPPRRGTFRVVDTKDRPVAGVPCQFQLPADFRSRIARVLDFSEEVTVRVESDAQGMVAPFVVGEVDRAYIELRKPGFLPARVPIEELAKTDRVVLRRPTPQPGSLLGRVIDQQGLPVDGAHVILGFLDVLTDERGHFHLPLGNRNEFRTLRAITPGAQPCTHRLTDAEIAAASRGDEPTFLHLQLGDAPLAISGRVLDPRGESVAGARVFVADPTPLGTFEGRISSAEGVLGDSATPVWHRGTSGADGGFELTGLMQRPYSVVAILPHSLVRSAPITVDAGARGIEIRLPIDRIAESVAGRVVDRNGQPLAGIRVFVTALVQQLRFETGKGASSHSDSGRSTLTDDRGAFRLADVGTQFVDLSIRGAHIKPRRLELFRDGRLIAAGPVDDMRIEVARRARFRVELADPSAAEEFGILDGDAKPMVIDRILGHSTWSKKLFPLHEGRSDVVSATDAATTLVLYKDGAEVRRVPIRLDAKDVTVIRP